MPIGFRQVQRRTIIPSGTIQVNTSGNVLIPFGVKSVSVTGRGGTGNPGSPGNPGSAGGTGNAGLAGAAGPGGAGGNAGVGSPGNAGNAGSGGARGNGGNGGSGGYGGPGEPGNPGNSGNAGAAGSAGSGGPGGIAGFTGNPSFVGGSRVYLGNANAGQVLITMVVLAAQAVHLKAIQDIQAMQLLPVVLEEMEVEENLEHCLSIVLAF